MDPPMRPPSPPTPAAHFTCRPRRARGTTTSPLPRAYARAKNVHCGEEMIYYRPGEPKEIRTKPQGDASS